MYTTLLVCLTFDCFGDFERFRTFLKGDLTVEYDIDGNVVNLACDFSRNTPYIEIKILSVAGGSGNYTITPIIPGAVSTTSINSGEGFSYFFSTMDQDNQAIGFTIDDGAGKSCKMDDSLILQLEVVNVSQACGCNNPVLVAIKPGDLTENISCGLNNKGEPALFVEVLDISGGVANANYEIKTLGAGKVFPEYIDKAPFRFYYTINQEDIDSNQPLGFQIFDEHVCFYEQFFLPPSSSIKTACEIDCYISGQVDLDDNDAIKLSCDLIDDELMASIQYTNIKGGNGNFIYENMLGNISSAITTEPGSLTYSFTPEDFATGQIDFFIKDTAINCVTEIDVAQLIPAFPIEQCMLCNYSLNLNKNSSGDIDIACDLRGDENRVVVTATIDSQVDLPILLEAFVGELSTSEVQSGEAFQYRFTATDFIDPYFGISASNSYADCTFIHLDYIPTDLFKNCIQVSLEDNLNTLLQHFNISQNLTQDFINLSWSAPIEAKQVQLINLKGQIIQSNRLNPSTNRLELDISAEKNGFYMVRLKTRHGLFQKKVLILR